MLRGQRVTLRAMTRDDLERLCQFNNDLEVELAGGGMIHLCPNLSRDCKPSMNNKSVKADEMALVLPSRPTVSLSAHVRCFNLTLWRIPVPWVSRLETRPTGDEAMAETQ